MRRAKLSYADLLRENAPVMRDAVIDAFAGNIEDLKRVATTETLDALARITMALRLHDENFASEIYSDILEQAINAPERWHDAIVDITLTPHPKHSGYFLVTARWEYTVTPTHSQRRFICLSDRDEYAELVDSDADASVWYMRPNAEFDAKDPDAYELMSFTVDGKEQRIRRSTRKGYQAYTVSIPKEAIEAGKPINVSYTTKTVTQSSGHLLFFDIEQPTHNISVNLDYTDANLAAISAIDLVPSVRPTRIEHSPETVPPKTVRVEIDGWTFPRSGVAFIWTLNSEAMDTGKGKAVKAENRGRS